jgi:endonuclease YncB( thermonuclease family)
LTRTLPAAPAAPLALAALLFASAAACGPPAEPVITGTVVAIHDGDTLSVLAAGRTVRVRLACIDAPEQGQAFGTRARQQLAEEAMRRTVRVEVVDHDSYGRAVGRVWVDGRLVNLELVRAGLAWHYTYHCPGDRALAAAEQEARAARRGLWAERDPLPPWQWRRRR